MIYYVTSDYTRGKLDKLKTIASVKRLQLAHPENTYLCPLFIVGTYNRSELSDEQKEQIAFDVLQMCDELILLGDNIERAAKEISLAKKIGMEISQYDIQSGNVFVFPA